MRSSFTKTKKAFLKSTNSQSVGETKNNESETEKTSKKVESKNSFKQLSKFFKSKKSGGKSSSDLLADVSKACGNEVMASKKKRPSSKNSSDGMYAFGETKAIDRSLSYSDIKSQNEPHFIDSEKYLIVVQEQTPASKKKQTYSNSVDQKNSFMRQRKFQMSMRKAFGIYDDITSPDIICHLNHNSNADLTSSQNSIANSDSQQKDLTIDSLNDSLTPSKLHSSRPEHKKKRVKSSCVVTSNPLNLVHGNRDSDDVMLRSKVDDDDGKNGDSINQIVNVSVICNSILLLA